jgi:hypothetical protein
VVEANDAAGTARADIALQSDRLLTHGIGEDAIRSGDIAALASVKLIVAEMNRVKREIDEFIDEARLKRSRH